MLGALSGSIAAVAGCVCGEAWPGYWFALHVEDVSQADGRWRTAVRATVSFLNVDDAEWGVQGLSLGAYGPEPTLLDATAVGSLRWGDVPESERESGECVTSGETSERVVLETERPPYYVGPRIDHEPTRSELDSHGADRFESIDALAYEGSVSVADWPPTSVAPDDYGRAPVRDLPWPRPEDSRVEETDAFQEVTFDVDSTCASEREPSPQLWEDSLDVSIEWARSIPEGRCARPVLQSVGRSGSTLVVEVGLHEVPHVPCRDCARMQYHVRAKYRDRASDGPVETAVVRHVAADGTVVEEARATTAE